MQAKLKEIVIPAAIGVVVALAGSSATAVTSAISAPGWLFDSFRSISLLPLGLLTWDVLVTHGLTLTLPAMALLLAAYRFLVPPSAFGTCGFLAGALATVYLLYPLLFNEPSLLSLPRQWWHHGLEIALLLAALASWGLGRFPRRSSSDLGLT